MTRYKRAVVLAGFGSMLPYIYPDLYYATINAYQFMSVNAQHLSGEHLRSVAVSFGVFLAPAALAVFFISLYREAAGLTTAGRRKAAAALSAFFMMMATVFITSNIHGSGVLRYNSQLILARGASLALASGFLFYLIPCVAWLTFFILFTIGSAPLLKRTTSNMAALLAVVMLSRGAWSSYVLYKVLPYEYQLLDWNHPVLPILWHLVLSPAIQVFAWVSSLIFLVVVWQHRSSADSAAGSFGR